MKISTLYAAIVPFAWIALSGHHPAPTSGRVAAPITTARDLDALRASLAPFSSFALAKKAGYDTAITDCMSNGDVGSMGIHWAKTSLINATVDPTQPEALIYEPGTNGEVSLVGVEFIVPFTEVSKTSPAPVLFGQKFSQNDVFGVWALHVWTHRTNPRGLFAPWNPRVHC
jgi:hypothetical protein